MSRTIESQQVSWWSVHEHVRPFLDRVDSWPLVGSPAWCALPDGPVKLAALLDAAQHWALRLDSRQEAMSEASKALSAAADWKDVERQTRNRRDVYIPRSVI
ncbi:DUF2742 domain-containing protein [Mycobacterium sp. HUMS_1102779]|uniref:DUF2742 domain-containing protein n=1 Tax=Mycobacterium sp. HUMS_1102779 TaxID=3383487 RepID=UPI00389AFDB2